MTISSGQCLFFTGLRWGTSDFVLLVYCVVSDKTDDSKKISKMNPFICVLYCEPILRIKLIFIGVSILC